MAVTRCGPCSNGNCPDCTAQQVPVHALCTSAGHACEKPTLDSPPAPPVPDQPDAAVTELECSCSYYVVDYSDPDRFHPENVDRENDPDCPVHAAAGVLMVGHCIGYTCGPALAVVWVECEIADEKGEAQKGQVPLCREHYDALMGPVGGAV